jgi:hypothetical protein
MRTLLFAFEEFPEERDAIGNMLLAYGEIEFALISCIGAVLDDDMDRALRILFRVRGEGARIEVSDAILRPAFAKVGLAPKWSHAVGAMRVCKNIRNQFAHCHWQMLGGQLKFMDLDTDAQSPEGDIRLSFLPIDGPLVQRQLSFFEYTLDWLYYLQAEYQVKMGRKASHDFHEPKSIAAPPRYIQEK